MLSSPYDPVPPPGNLVVCYANFSYLRFHAGISAYLHVSYLKFTTMVKKIGKSGIILLLALFGCGPATPGESDDRVSIELYYPSNEMDPVLGVATHIYFTPEKEIITDLSHNSFLYRRHGEDTWHRSHVPVNGPHSIAYHPGQDLYYVNDTENHRMISFRKLDQTRIESEKDTIAGVGLNRIHDVIYDQASGWIYALDPYGPTLFRFKGLDEPAEKMTFPDQQGYARALSLVDSKLYLILSEHGRIIEIADWEENRYTVQQSFGHKRPAPAGSYVYTGLIPNDAEYFNGKWYVSSFFCQQYDPNSTTFVNRNNLIRFETWDDFKSGNWEDLSDLLPEEDFIPYFMTVHDNKLFLAGFFFEPDENKQGGRIYVIR